MLDESEGLEGLEGLAQEGVAAQAEGVGGQLGLHAGAQAGQGLGAVALDVELLGQLAVDGLDRLAEVGLQPLDQRVVPLALVAAGGRQ